MKESKPLYNLDQRLYFMHKDRIWSSGVSIRVTNETKMGKTYSYIFFIEGERKELPESRVFKTPEELHENLNKTVF